MGEAREGKAIRMRCEAESPEASEEGAPIAIEDLADPRVAAFAGLTERQLRSRLEPEQGIFIAESPKVIARALDAGYEALAFLMEERHIPAAWPLVERARAASGTCVPVYTGSREVLAGLTGFELTRGVLAACRRPALPEPEALLAGARRVAVLDGIVDHTNVGAAFRSAAALGVDAVLATPTCCDPLYRRAIRVSMGTVFQVPWTRIGDSERPWPRWGIGELHRLGFTVAAFALKDDSIPLGDASLAGIERLALVFGTEGDGLSDAVIGDCDLTVRIPMAHGVDSLNVAAASAVAFWELCKGR